MNTSVIPSNIAKPEHGWLCSACANAPKNPIRRTRLPELTEEWREGLKDLPVAPSGTVSMIDRIPEGDEE